MNVSPFFSSAAMNIEFIDSLGFPEKMATRELVRGRGMEVDFPLAKAHFFLSLSPLGCFCLDIS